MKIEKWTARERYDALVNNSLDWYLVDYLDGRTELKHESEVSNILQCGFALGEFGIDRIQQCWNGEELGAEGEV